MPVPSPSLNSVIRHSVTNFPTNAPGEVHTAFARVNGGAWLEVAARDEEGRPFVDGSISPPDTVEFKVARATTVVEESDVTTYTPAP